MSKSSDEKTAVYVKRSENSEYKSGSFNLNGKTVELFTTKERNAEYSGLVVNGETLYFSTGPAHTSKNYIYDGERRMPRDGAAPELSKLCQNAMQKAFADGFITKQEATALAQLSDKVQNAISDHHVSADELKSISDFVTQTPLRAQKPSEKAPPRR